MVKIYLFGLKKKLFKKDFPSPNSYDIAENR